MKHSKNSIREIKRLVSDALEDEFSITPGCQLSIDDASISGRPPSHISLWCTLHFMQAGSPFCCSEPGCHLPLLSDAMNRIQNRVARRMGLAQELSVVFEAIVANIHAGVEFVPQARRRLQIDQQNLHESRD